MQDKESHESGHLSYSIGSQVGFSYGYEKAEKAWVGEQSKIIGTESVNMAGKTLSNKGAVIAQINPDGTDGGNMDMNFDKIEVSDIKDKDERDAMSVGVHVSVGGSYGTDSGLRGPNCKVGRSQRMH
ncbi:MAG: hypothetical protein O3A01_05735 [bacterium]|nr:hypothetical protein [bacterium]